MKPKVTENLFKAAKTLIKGGATNKEVAEYLCISAWTVNEIKKSEDYIEYKNNVCARYSGSKKEQKQQIQENPVSIVEHKQSVTIQANHYVEMELKKQTEILTLLSNKLTYIMENVEKMMEVWSK